ncbi:MAG: TauD/TfdA dioxygenase family protein [Acidimicrobiales bacterium]
MIEISKFGAPLGGLVHGVDLRSLDDVEFAAIQAAFAEHLVLAFPGQDLTIDEQLAFARRWGQLQKHPYYRGADYPELMRLDNQGKAKDPNEHWHSDMSYEPTPPKITMLYALEAPAIGGDTAFANQHVAFNELSNSLQEQRGPLTAAPPAEGPARLYKRDPADAPQSIHPVIRRHEDRGDDALYVCRAFTTKFEGWRPTESQGLLHFLFEHSARPDFQARHQWNAGDLVMWDNRSVLHYAVHDHGDDARTIHRVQVQGDTSLSLIS